MTVRKFSGFTLIEMLIVVVIVTILSGMVMTLISQAKRAAQRSATLSVERKVETALRLFKDEYVVYPYMLTYPALSSTAVGQYYPNNLHYRIGTNISTVTGGDRDKVMADINEAKTEYAYNGNLAGPYGGTSAIPAQLGNVEFGQPSGFTYTANMIITDGSIHKYASTPTSSAFPIAPSTVAFEMSVCTDLNRMAQEWVTNAMVAGAVAVKGQVVFDQFGAVITNLSNQTILANPASASNPGWANDYLAGDLDARFISGNDIVDAWHHPLIYISQNIPGIKAYTSQTNGFSLMPYDTRYYGLGPQGFDAGSGPTTSVANANRRVLLESGRILLNLSDAGDGQPSPTDATYFPYSGNLIQSDMRYYAASGYQTEFELWSAGYDGLFSYLRSDPANYDNISATDYNRGLQ